jgi:hypothetical protein
VFSSMRECPNVSVDNRGQYHGKAAATFGLTKP